MLRKLSLPILAIAMLFLVIGCSSGPSETDVDQTININDDFGGYTATSESPAFGDTELLAADEGEEEVDDPMLASAGVAELMEDVNSGMFHFRAVWGRLEYDSTVTEVTDWTGSLTITRGAELVRRLIRFEYGQDSLIPRTDRTLIEWASFTTVHHDGIAVDLIVPPMEPTYDTTVTYETNDDGDTVNILIEVDTTMPEPVMVTFETGPYTRTFSLNELAALDEVVDLDDGNSVAFHAIQVTRIPCPRGFLAGHWGPDSTGQGIFSGRWISQHGYVDGYLKGYYGVTDAGRKVFYGKWINRSGEFEGFLRGTYRQHANHHANHNGRLHSGGDFRGLIYNADKVKIGALHGHYKNANQYRSGFFAGRWKTFCNATSANGDFNYDDGFDEDFDWEYDVEF